jgi:hypothetical protein
MQLRPASVISPLLLKTQSFLGASMYLQRNLDSTQEKLSIEAGNVHNQCTFAPLKTYYRTVVGHVPIGRFQAFSDTIIWAMAIDAEVRVPRLLSACLINNN